MNAYEALMMAATAGVEPDDDDLAAVRPIPGVDETTFRRTTAAAAREIAALRREGANGEARKRAQAAAEEYDAAFRALLPGSIEPPPESVQDIAARMFSS